jgi:hypothetical protein
LPQPDFTIHYARVTDVEQFILEHYVAIAQSAAFLMLVLNSACRDADLEIDAMRSYAGSLANEVRDPDAPGTREWVLRVAEHMIYALARVVKRLESAKRAMVDLRADPWAP